MRRKGLQRRKGRIGVMDFSRGSNGIRNSKYLSRRPDGDGCRPPQFAGHLKNVQAMYLYTGIPRCSRATSIAEFFPQL